mgnify:CR=1 FL=1
MKESTEIIEIVFERVPLEKLAELLNGMLLNSTLIGYSVSTDSSEVDLQSKETLSKSIDQSSDGSFYFNFTDCRMSDIPVSGMGFQILKYDSLYDLNLHIEEKEIRRKVSILDFQKRVASLAEELATTNYYCGYEPAIDPETRMFSGISLGPIVDWGSLDQCN